MSAIWNLAFDAGIGAGAFGFGVVAARTGYLAAFAAAAALVLAALVPLALDRAHRDRARPSACIQISLKGARVGLQRVLLYTTRMSGAAEKAYEAIRDGIVGGASVGGRLREEGSWPAASG